MSGLQVVMQTEKPLSKDEIIREYLSEVIERVGRKQRFFGTKGLPNGANNSPVESY